MSGRRAKLFEGGSAEKPQKTTSLTGRFRWEFSLCAFDPGEGKKAKLLKVGVKTKRKWRFRTRIKARSRYGGFKGGAQAVTALVLLEKPSA